MHPIPKHTRQTVLKCDWWQAERTIRKIETANGPPNESGRFVTRMNAGPRRFSVSSLAASDADADDAGYSPPAPGNWSTMNPVDSSGVIYLTESNDPTSNRHHPEHAVNGDPMRGSRQDAAYDDHRRGKDDGRFAA